MAQEHRHSTVNETVCGFDSQMKCIIFSFFSLWKREKCSALSSAIQHVMSSVCGVMWGSKIYVDESWFWQLMDSNIVFI